MSTIARQAAGLMVAVALVAGQAQAQFGGGTCQKSCQITLDGVSGCSGAEQCVLSPDPVQPEPKNMLWTSVGSAGVVNGANSGLIVMGGEAATTTTGGGIVTLRYNVTAVPGMSTERPGGSKPPLWGLRARIRDESNASLPCSRGCLPALVPKHGIVLRLKEVRISTGVVTTKIVLDSNDFPTLVGSRVIATPDTTSCSDTHPFDFDFVNNAYYIEALFRSAQFVTPLKLHALQILQVGCVDIIK